MTFLYPLGLLGLIGIPILIIIYIIKSKYTEQTIASTWLWELSERFLKRKKRVSRLTGIIALILQLLAVTLISLAIAHPILTVPNSAQEYCFILDASGSMQMQTEDGKTTRFETAKEKISGIVGDAVAGSRYTLIHVGNETTYYEAYEDKEEFLSLLESVKPSDASVTMTGALDVVQRISQKRPGVKAYLISDTQYESATNVETVYVGAAVDNYAISDVNYTHLATELKVSGKVISYENDATVNVGLFLNEETEPRQVLEFQLKKGEAQAFTLEATAESFSSITVKVLEEDALAMDSVFVIHEVKSENSYNTLIVSENPFFLESAVRSVLNAKIDVIAPEEFRDDTRGYGLYIFDSLNVDDTFKLPTDGTVWFVNINASVEGTGFTVRNDMELPRPEKLDPSTSSSTLTKTLLSGMLDNDIYITRYIKCGVPSNFTTLYNYNGTPVVFAGTTEHGTREVVIAFSLHHTNLAVLHDFSVMMRNLINYSFPDMVENTNYNCGDMAVVNMIANCDSVRVESPSGEISYLNTNGATDNIPMKEVGAYTVTMTVAGTARQFYVWSSLQEAERDPTQTVSEITLQMQGNTEGFDGEFDPLTIMFIVLALVFLADWMVYCYEKYQLR